MRGGLVGLLMIAHLLIEGQQRSLLDATWNDLIMGFLIGHPLCDLDCARHPDHLLVQRAQHVQRQRQPVVRQTYLHIPPSQRLAGGQLKQLGI